MGNYTHKNNRRRKQRSGRLALSALVLVLMVFLLGLIVFKQASLGKAINPGDVAFQIPKVTPSVGPENTPAVDVLPAEPVETEPEPTPEPTPEPLPEFAPYSVDSTNPWNLLEGTARMVDGAVVETYAAEEKIDFGLGRDYTEVEGIITFRGNNFRDSAAYGVTSMTQKKFGNYWTVTSSSLQCPGGAVWTGSGWVGQPLIRVWSKDERSHMNMYDWAKQQEELTEVIYATMGGYVYFLELDTGKPTRDSLYLGYTFKGAGALDPRGYPILYLGSGYDSFNGKSRVFIINLLNCSVMFEFGHNDSFNLRGNLSFFDGSPLVDAETDQLIYPGESGIMYIMKLNTAYDKDAGSLSISPSKIVKWRYYATRSAGRYLGMEDSPVIWRGHIIMAENGGNLFCVDLNTLEVVWAQDVLDDTNCSPVLELEDGHPYIYISTSFHYGWRSTSTATIPIWKIDAVTGEIVWHTDYTCYTVSGVSGGVQGTLALGKKNISDLIYVPVARTGGGESGKLVALYKETGEVAWEFDSYYAWSSPVDVYDAEGNGYIIYCTCGGYMYLLDGRTGAQLDARDLGSNIEASPAVFYDTVVVGTRGQLIYGIKLT